MSCFTVEDKLTFACIFLFVVLVVLIIAIVAVLSAGKNKHTEKPQPQPLKMAVIDKNGTQSQPQPQPLKMAVSDKNGTQSTVTITDTKEFIVAKGLEKVVETFVKHSEQLVPQETSMGLDQTTAFLAEIFQSDSVFFACDLTRKIVLFEGVLGFDGLGFVENFFKNQSFTIGEKLRFYLESETEKAFLITKVEDERKWEELKARTT